ncbi:hypothetical protein CC78DRAFT_535529 [Lojkania enalia]|uniref:Uncharacterized protein n=1 Tax=Lojkania enalia TaxID=147567 RepID=A0A9P4N7B4_9PLEO|nr:hypothetical protein CC78DRAFT_535529 [Didymosphaeria enalia]
MQCPKLTPLQSRLLASAIATSILIVIWISFQPHNFVYAAELPLHDPLEHATLEDAAPHPGLGERLIGVEVVRDGDDGNAEVEQGYAPDFAYFDRSMIGRQEEVEELQDNDRKDNVALAPGSTHNFKIGNSGRQVKREDLGSEVHSPLDERRTRNGSELGHERESKDSSDSDEAQELKKRQGNRRTIFISVNTCRQPTAEDADDTSGAGQLALWVSTSPNNKKPGPGANADLATEKTFERGYVSLNVSTESEVYIGIAAPSLPDGKTGDYSFQIAVSDNQYYHNLNRTAYLYFVDSDSDSALFITNNFTDNNASLPEYYTWLDMQSPFTMYAFDEDTWSKGMLGLEFSNCGLQEQFSKMNNISVERNMTVRYGMDGPKALLNVEGLTAGKTYKGFLVANGNTSTGTLALPGQEVLSGGNRLYSGFEFQTKADDTCQVIFDLEFCTDIAYAVPSSERFKTNTSGLAALYDGWAKEYFQDFNKSLAQVACNTTASAMYSLARGCPECREDYKSWLCSVLMPRCHAFSDTREGLIERNINSPFSDGTFPYANNLTAEFNATFRNRMAFNQSRNKKIDEVIQPGPYKELLPCDELCFGLVRSCPAQLGFACPNEPAMSLSYGVRDKNTRSMDFHLTCNFPGAITTLDTFKGVAGRLGIQLRTMFLVAGVTGVLLLV